MARYTGPKSRIARRFGEPIFGPDKALDGSHRACLEVPARRESIDEVNMFLEAQLDEVACPPDSAFLLMLAAEEIFVNIASYAYPDGEGELEMEIGVSEDGKEIRMVLKDQGIPFNPLKRTREEAVNNLKKMLPGGLGIYLVQQYADELDYRYENEQNIITFVKRGTAED